MIDAPDVTVEATGAKTPVTLAATASDLVDGSVAVTYTLENGGPLDPGGFTIGSHELTAHASDAVGNTATKDFMVTVQDTTAPVIDAPDVTVEATGAKTPVTLAATASDLVDGSVAVTYTLENGGPLDPGGFTIGSHELTAHASDAVGNTATKDFMVTVQDTIAPQIGDNITKPWYTGAVNVQLTATDGGSGVATFAYTLGNPGDPATVWTPYTAPFAVSGEGTHTVSYYAVDGAGNRSDAQAVIHIDDTKPVTSDNTDGFWHRSFVLELKPKDAGGSDVVSTEYRINGGPWQSGTSCPLRTRRRHHSGGLANGAHTVEFFSTDRAGNTEAIVSRTVLLDHVRP